MSADQYNDTLLSALREIIAISSRTPRRAVSELNPLSVALTKAEQIAREAIAKTQGASQDEN